MAATFDFETKCYENDWEFVLRPGFLETAVRRCGHVFATRRLIVNNVRDRNKVESAAQGALARGAIDEYVFAQDHAGAALAMAGLRRDELGAGYEYSISEFVGLSLCQSEYLLHFASDSAMYANQPDWISPALALMSLRPEVAVANPAWNRAYSQAAQESLSVEGNFWLGFGFSDQCYLVRAAEFRRPIYNFRHEASQRYPAYGGELFEKRVDSYMRFNGRLRATHRFSSYRHRNFPKSGWRRLWRRLGGNP